MRILIRSVLLVAMIGSAHAAVTTYTDEAAYLNALSALGFSPVQESFEDDAVWGSVRTTIAGGAQTVPSITSLGVTWTSNNNSSEVTTGSGPARTGNWGFFTLPHGNYLTGTACDVPGNCGDGFIGTSVGSLFGIGGWISTPGTGAEVNFILDGMKIVELGNIPFTGHDFRGVIDTQGFQTFEVREIEGTAEDQKLIFADDFTFALSADCVGDCDGGGSVTVDELVKGVNIALGILPLDRCLSLDINSSDTVTVDELVTAVNHALNGCPTPRMK